MKPPTDPAKIEGRNCDGMDLDTFYPAATDISAIYAAKKICNGCPAIDACLEWALHHERGVGHSGRSGVYGGLSERQRATVSRKRRKDATEPAPLPEINHGTQYGYKAHRKRGEEACDLCLEARRVAKAASRARGAA